VRVGVVDYTVGNIGSVLNALRRAGAGSVIIRRPEEARDADALVLPGVGTYAAACRVVREFRAAVLERPTLAICLGMQLLFEGSQEGGGRGLGLFRGVAERVEARKVPHIGWSYTHVPRGHDVVQEGYYYYMHGYGVPWREGDESYVAYVQLGKKYAAAVSRGAILGVQFHPERSGRAGIELIRRFLKRARA
jgi:glutamine amidotransferase